MNIITHIPKGCQLVSGKKEEYFSKTALIFTKKIVQEVLEGLEMFEY